MPFIPNGSDPSAFDPNEEPSFSEHKKHHKHKHHKHSKPDVAERGMDSDVWGFTTESDATPPYNAVPKPDLPWLPNGVKNQYAQ